MWLLTSWKNIKSFRDEKGYCSITYRESTGTSVDSFSILNPAAPSSTTAESTTGYTLQTSLDLVNAIKPPVINPI